MCSLRSLTLDVTQFNERKVMINISPTNWRLFHLQLNKGEGYMKWRNRQYIKVMVELLEDRIMPSYIGVSPAPFTVQGLSDNDRVTSQRFQLQATISPSSDAWGMTDPLTGNGHWEVARSTPSPFQEVATPTPQEWNVLTACPELFPDLLRTPNAVDTSLQYRQLVIPT